MKAYHGIRRDDGTTEVRVILSDGTSHDLKPRHDVIRYGTPFGWGPTGGESLALALLAEHLGPVYPDSCPVCSQLFTIVPSRCPFCLYEIGAKVFHERAMDLHQAFMAMVLARLPADEWRLQSHDIECAIALIRIERQAAVA